MKKIIICLSLMLVMVLSIAMPALAAGEEIPEVPTEAAGEVYMAPEQTTEEPADEPEAASSDDVMPVATLANSGYCGEGKNWTNVKWRLSSDGTLTIYGKGDICNCELDAPSWCEFNGDSITFNRIKKVVIENGVTGIGAAAFAGHMNLQTVTIPDSVTNIDGDAFRDCISLTDVMIPKSVKHIGFTAFGGCSRLHTITILNKNCNIEDETRYQASVYDTLGVPRTTTIIGYAGSTAEKYARRNGFAFQAIKEGWYKESGYWYYYRAGSMITNNWVQDGGKWYWLDEYGRMATGWWYINGESYYFNSSGVMQTGWISYYGDWYYADSDGAAVVNDWRKIGGKWYWFDEDGVMASDGRAYIDGEWYCFDANGAMRTGWVKDGSAWYYYKSSGAMARGWLKDGKTWYYLDPDTGVMAANTTRTIGGKSYMFNASGAMRTGWINLGGGDYYYADGSGALVKNGWIKSGKYWYWLKSDGLMARNETLIINGTEYAFNNSGAWVTAGAAANRTAYSQYRSIVQNAASYFRDFGGIYECTGYKYALVQMDPSDSTQTLLLGVEDSGMLLNIYLYRYEPSTGRLLHPTDYLRDGVAGAGGFRGFLAICADGYGLISTYWSSGSGNAGIDRITMSGNSLRYDTVWTGNMYYDSVPDYGGFDIVWHNTNDLSALN